MSAHAYQHSASFASLKGIQEQLPQNLTSVEYLTSLDTMLANALLPLMSCSRHVDVFAGKILAWQSTHPKRKTASVQKQELPARIAAFLIQSEPQDKLNTYMNIGFDRGITFEILRVWIRLMEKYEALADDVTSTGPAKLRQMELALAQANVTDPSSAYVSYLQVKYWVELAYQFKAVILEKYTRMVLMITQQDYVRLQCKVPLNDMVQEYMLSAMKAIDRCDATKGVLTTYIQSWLRSARNVVAKKYINDTEVSVDDSRPDDDDTRETGYARYAISVFTTDEEVEDTDSEDQQDRQRAIYRVRQLARVFDPTGCARLVLGIDEYITPQVHKELTGQ